MPRFGSALNLNPHLPILMLDGVYVPHPDSGQPTFVAVPPPTDQQVQHLIEPAAVRLIQPLEKRDVLADTETNALPEQPPVWSGLTAASVQGTQALGPHAGQRLRRWLTDPATGQRTAPLSAPSSCPAPATSQRATCHPASVKHHRKTPNPAPILLHPALPR